MICIVTEDDRHPTCARCNLGGFLCQGYADPVLFVDEMPRVQRAVRVYNSKKSNERRSECYEDDSEPMPAIEEARHLQQREPFTRIHDYNDALCLTASPSTSSFEEGIHLSFLCSKLFFGAPARGQKTLVEKAWIYRFALLSTSGNEHEPDQIAMSLTFTLATQALAKAFFGQMHGHQSIVVKGAELYGSALRSLHGDLQHPNYLSFSLLASLITVYVYEVRHLSFSSYPSGIILTFGSVSCLHGS
jgi:hypothetical protein